MEHVETNVLSTQQICVMKVLTNGFSMESIQAKQGYDHSMGQEFRIQIVGL